MINKKKIIEEIEAIGLKVKILSFGFCVYPSDESSNVIYTAQLNKLLVIAQKYGLLGHYINFDDGFVRLF